MLIKIPLVDSFGNSVFLEGCLTIPDERKGRDTNTNKNLLIIFVHGSGSSKDSPRNQYLAKELNKNSITTFLFDLLTKEEEDSDKKVEKIQNQIPGLTLNKFNISLLANRLIMATEYLLEILPELKKYTVGYFGASTGVAASIIAATALNPGLIIKTIISRGGRADLVSANSSSSSFQGNFQSIKNIPLLFIIGEKDKVVLDLTSKFIKKYDIEKNSKIQIVKNATHLFEEEGTLEKVGDMAVKWLHYL